MITIKQAAIIYKKSPENIRLALIRRNAYVPVGFLDNVGRSFKARKKLLGFDEDIINDIFDDYKPLPRGRGKKYVIGRQL